MNCGCVIGIGGIPCIGGGCCGCMGGEYGVDARYGFVGAWMGGGIGIGIGVGCGGGGKVVGFAPIVATLATVAPFVFVLALVLSTSRVKRLLK